MPFYRVFPIIAHIDLHVRVLTIAQETLLGFTKAPRTELFSISASGVLCLVKRNYFDDVKNACAAPSSDYFPKRIFSSSTYRQPFA